VAISYHVFLQRDGRIPDTLSLKDFISFFNNGKYVYGRWNDHVTNWLDAHSDALIVRYEDMLAEGERQLRRVLNFLDRPVDEDRISAAVQKVQFDRLQQKEKERIKKKDSDDPDEEELFFRKGKKRQWESQFSEEMNANFIRQNRDALQRLGYLMEQ
jgi:hypothetical protein